MIPCGEEILLFWVVSHAGTPMIVRKPRKYGKVRPNRLYFSTGGRVHCDGLLWRREGQTARTCYGKSGTA